MPKMKKVGAALTVAGLAAAAGYYFYKSKDAKKHRKMAAGWANNFKKEVERRLNELPETGRAAVNAAVDTATAVYKRRGKYRAEIEHLAKELKTNWQKLKKEVMPKGTRSRRKR